MDLPLYQERDPYLIAGYDDVLADVTIEGMIRPAGYPQHQQPEMVHVGAVGEEPSDGPSDGSSSDISETRRPPRRDDNRRDDPECPPGREPPERRPPWTPD